MFEVLVEDLLGRIGRLRTRSGKVVETPVFLPVINPVTQDIPANWMKENLGAEAVITNAYIISKRLREEALSRGVHGLLNFDGAIMTDSGGYQILEYGDVDTTPEDIANLQEDMGSDIAVPLDIPTGMGDRTRAEETVKKTLDNLRKTLETLAKRGERRALWTAPVQGGIHIDLLRECARAELEMEFDLFALGSPTPLMEGYHFGKLFKMLYSVRLTIGFGKPLHLFGAGHPMIFPFIVALGADMFDSASYYLYAKDERYLTETGTLRVDRLDYLPCCCPVCSKTDARELKELEKRERVQKLAMHNLYMCFQELRRIRQAIKDGRLMELLEIRARSHPRLYQGFIELMENDELLNEMKRHTPISSRKGINLYDELSLKRPEVAAAKEKLIENYFGGGRALRDALLLPSTFDLSIEKAVKLAERLEILFYGTPFGLIPYSLRYSYPFSQTNYPKYLLKECLWNILETSISQISLAGYENVYLLKAKSRHLEDFAKELVGRLRGSGIIVKEIEDLRELQEP
ncbi:MAG: tRNA guanosine(15) transglycosylase TgtA [Aigarchaeota archaeon]|nr:tRNA guanosine(15) transglycosylase TgtA [Aigarchaeota archaeon]